MKYLSHNHYAISDREAGRLASTYPGNAGKLPRIGYERDVVLPDGECLAACNRYVVSQIPAVAA